MLGKIQIWTVFIIFNTNFVASLHWPDVTDINSIHDFFEAFNSIIDNEYKITSFMNEEGRNYEIKNFVNEMLKIFNSFNETDDYKSNFSWDEFDIKLKDYRMNKNNTLSLLPHIIFQGLRTELNTLESLINRFFKNKISSHIDDIQILCSFPLSHSISQSELTYSHIKESYRSLTGEIERREAKSETTDVDCDEHLFLQDLYDLSKEILKGFVLKFFRSSIGLSLKSKCSVDTNVQKKLIHQRNHFMTNVTKFMNFTRDYLGKFSEYLYACDFSNHTRDKTYIELERMYQIMIENEYYLDKDGSCSYNCDTKGEHFKPEVNYMCKDLDCQYMGDKFEICQLDDDVRRYQWFRDENNHVYGNDTNCKGEMITYNSWYQWTTRYCDYCVCVCTAKPHREVHNEITAISFQDQVSDTDSNKVVLDLKFVIKNNTIYVDIKEGKLLPHGKIDNNSVSWKALDNCTIFDKFTFCTYPRKIGETYNLTTAAKDFGYPEYLNLGDIKASRESVVTGVRFRFAGDFNSLPKYKNGSVEMQIRLTDFDYSTGKLSKSHIWISSNSEQPKTELLLPSPDNPIKSPKNIPNLKGNQFVKFKVSDLKKDAGQSTVPFFDARPVESKVLFPLRGIGLFHRGYEGFGGFIAFKLFIISPQEYMNTELVTTKSVAPSSINIGWDIFSGLRWN